MAGEGLGVLLPRVALYSVLSAVEEDVRLVLGRNLEALEPSDALGDELYGRALERARRDVGDAVTSLTQILPYTDFGDAWQLIGRNAERLPPFWVEARKRHSTRIEALASVRNRVMHSRPLEFDDLPLTMEFVEALRADEALDTPRLQEAMHLLESNPAALLNRGVPQPDESESHNLPFPDFDETGFIGRRRALDEIKNACLGTYPVVTIVGDGGLGKTAAALKVAYELLDDPASPFEATVWSTSKTTQLTAPDVVRIDGAISSSLGLMTSVAAELGGTSSDPVDEVLEYLAQFRILLVLDNLETVLDARIEGFLRRLPAGSKVLITSRIGLRALEYPVRLPKLTNEESVQLLRALAHVRGMSALLKIDNRRLAQFCARMNNNPLWMKWFVSGVQAGARPEDLLANPRTFLDFSMSNVYEHLAETSRQVLQALQVSAGRKSQAELAFLTELDVDDLQTALGQLCASNMVTMASTPTGSSFETDYQLAELAKTYLAKRHPVDKSVHTRVTSRHRQLRSAGQQIREAQQANPYQIRSLDLRATGNLIVARHLLDALDAARRGDLDAADGEIARAKALAPEWYEVHRVEALTQTRAGNVTGAQDAFECALELEPNSAPLRLRYGMFKLDHLDDPRGAVEELELALRIDQESLDCRLEITRALQREKSFEASRRYLNELLSQQARLPQLKVRMLYDLEMQQWMRLAEKLASEGDHERGSRALASLARAFHQCPPKLRDDKIRGRLTQALPIARRILRYSFDEDVKRRLTAFITWVESGQWIDSVSPDEAGVGAKGTVVKLIREKGYGFLRLRDGDEVFFHFSDLEFPEVEAEVGQEVRCDIGRGREGTSRALHVTLSASANDVAAQTERART